ncbi:DUF2147 domain-containing protein [Mucilaginibacter terrenus]|nr:DUF2147 domain-containing protein [Mucilaginibacter terrenus]
MMANKLLCSFLAFVFYSGTVYHTNNVAAADQICGKWQSQDKNLVVQIFKEDEAFKAKIIWFDNGEGEQAMHTFTDKYNPNPALRTRKVLGMNVLENLEYSADTDSWENGIIYDASSGKHYNSCAKINKDGSLNVKGYWHFKFIGKSIRFNRM